MSGRIPLAKIMSRRLGKERPPVERDATFGWEELGSTKEKILRAEDEGAQADVPSAGMIRIR